MTEKKEVKRALEENLCPGSLLPESECDCLDCRGEFFNPSKMFAECRNIGEMTHKFEETLQYFNYLKGNAWNALVEHDYTVHLIPCLVGGNYWVHCPGCFYPVLLPNGADSNILCKDCHAILQTRDADGLHPKYYQDLFDYLNLMFDWEKTGERSFNEDYWFTREFCETHGFDFDAIRARLQATGGFDDSEVMHNSQFNIPLFDELPQIIGDN